MTDREKKEISALFDKAITRSEELDKEREKIIITKTSLLLGISEEEAERFLKSNTSKKRT